MGYTVNGGGTIYVPTDRARDALIALKDWAVDNEPIPWGDHRAIGAAQTIAEVFSAMGFETYDNGTDDSGAPGFAIEHGDSWAQEYDQAAAVLGPFATADSECEWEGEDDCRWRWYFTGTEMREEYAELAYEPEVVAAKADADALDRLAELVALPEWKIDGSAASWIEAAAEIVKGARPAQVTA